MAARRIATYEVEYEVIDEEALLDEVFRDGRPEVDPGRHLGIAIDELMRPALITAAGVRLIRAHGRDRPTHEAAS